MRGVKHVSPIEFRLGVSRFWAGVSVPKRYWANYRINFVFQHIFVGYFMRWLWRFGYNTEFTHRRQVYLLKLLRRKQRYNVFSFARRFFTGRKIFFTTLTKKLGYFAKGLRQSVLRLLSPTFSGQVAVMKPNQLAIICVLLKTLFLFKQFVSDIGQKIIRVYRFSCSVTDGYLVKQAKKFRYTWRSAVAREIPRSPLLRPIYIFVPSLFFFLKGNLLVFLHYMIWTCRNKTVEHIVLNWSILLQYFFFRQRITTNLCGVSFSTLLKKQFFSHLHQAVYLKKAKAFWNRFFQKYLRYNYRFQFKPINLLYPEDFAPNLYNFSPVFFHK